jgi:uncharacterized protein
VISNKGGEGSFDQVMRGLDTLKKHNVDFNIMCTVHAANQNHPLDLYHFFRDEQHGFQCDRPDQG